MLFKSANQSGISVVEALVSLAIVAMTVASLNTHLVQTEKVQVKANIDYDRELLKTVIVKTVSCERSPQVSVCPSSAPIALNKIDKNLVTQPFISAQGAGTKLGAWTVRAECNATNDGFLIRVARLKPGGTLISTADSAFLPNPQDGRIIRWDHPDSLLLGENIALCGGRVGAYPPPDFVTPWFTPPATITHNLGTDKVYVGIQSQSSGSLSPLLEQWDFDFNYAVATRHPQVIVDQMTTNSLRVWVDDYLRSGISSPYFGTDSRIDRVQLSIWRIN